MSDAELIGNYKLVSVIASGQHSQVWEVVDATTTERLAMKILLKEAFAESEQKNAIRHEARVAKSLEHPNVIRFHKEEFTKQHAFYTMELFKAPNLKNQIQAEINSVHLRIKRLVELTCLALAHMHDKGWLHKDVKPDNILMSRGSELRLIDFSLAARIPTGLAAIFGGRSKVQGTRTYMSPEQIRGQRLSIQTDVYNFGITLFEILVGKPPFQGSSPNDLLRKHLVTTPPLPSDLNPNVTPEMDRMVSRMLAKKPADRHKDMNELMAEFRSVKVFKEEISESVADADALETFDLGERRDSRSDHLQSQKGAGESAAKKPEPAKPAATKPAAAKPATGAPAAKPSSAANPTKPASAPAKSANPKPAGTKPASPNPATPAPAAKSPPKPVAAPAKPKPAPKPETKPESEDDDTLSLDDFNII